MVKTTAKGQQEGEPMLTSILQNLQTKFINLFLVAPPSSFNFQAHPECLRYWGERKDECVLCPHKVYSLVGPQTKVQHTEGRATF